MPYISSQYFEKLDELPEAIQDAIGSNATTDAIFAIGKKHGLHIDTLENLTDETWLVLLGVTPTAAFVGKLAARLKIPQDQAGKIAHDIDTEIFEKIRDSLKEVHVQEQEKRRGIIDSLIAQPQTQGTEAGKVAETEAKAAILADIENPPETPLRAPASAPAPAPTPEPATPREEVPATPVPTAVVAPSPAAPTPSIPPSPELEARKVPITVTMTPSQAPPPTPIVPEAVKEEGVPPVPVRETPPPQPAEPTPAPTPTPAQAPVPPPSEVRAAPPTRIPPASIHLNMTQAPEKKVDPYREPVI